MSTPAQPATTPVRPPSAIDAVADRYVVDACALDPFTATVAGVPGHDHEVTDYSPAGCAARADLARAALAALDALGAQDTANAQDAVDGVTLAAMRERLGLDVEIAEAGLDSSSLNVIASPVQHVRDVFDLMPTATAQDWSVIAERLGRVGASLAGAVESWREAAASGVSARVPARRQVLAVAEQCDSVVGTGSGDGQFERLIAAAAPDGAPPSPELAAALAGGAAEAGAAFAEVGRVLREELLPLSREDDAVGRDAYRLLSRAHLGAAVDLDETYAWGLAEVARLEAEMREVAEQLLPGATVAEVIAHLDADPARRLHGTDALQRWMQELSDAAMAALTDVHFDIPEPVRRLDCRIAPSSSGGIYYTPPSEDFSRPGTMWWSVPPGVTSFGTWTERTTVFHEGVPGHHLQVGQTMVRPLNRWRRVLCWVPGHGEGWALYAERLMADLGWLDDPADRLGMLESSLFRAARVVVDIGLHCGLATPEELGGGTWDADAVWAYLTAHTFQQEDVLRFEHLRYLGWPGQAPAYKVGERVWRELREQVREREGDGFDVAAFHRRALDIGSVGLDVLRAEVVAGRI